MEKKYFVVEEDTGVYNIFSVDDFDADGYLLEHNGEDGYHMDDFEEQVVYKTDSFKDAVDWEERHSKY
jgi:hypothetical protein